MNLSHFSRHLRKKRSFFFSSRRRHTRYIGDWSSDVCSSDLIALRLEREICGVGRRPGLDEFKFDFDQIAGVAFGDGHSSFADLIIACPGVDRAGPGWSRSEERRVGKAGRLGETRERARETRC